MSFDKFRNNDCNRFRKDNGQGILRRSQTVRDDSKNINIIHIASNRKDKNAICIFPAFVPDIQADYRFL